LFLAGCGGGGNTKEAESKKAEDAKSAAAPATAMDDANAATVTGKVSFAGDKPAMRNIDMSANPACARAHTGGPQKSEEVVVNDNGTVRYAFVWVKAGVPDRQWPAAAAPVELDQEGCMYKPHVIGVMTNQDIKIVNSDPTNHNIHPLPKVNQEWNESQPPKGDSKLKHFAREEIMIPVKCNVHPWMKSYMAVLSHPYFQVTGKDGSFEIKNVPPGTYMLTAWHESLGTTDMSVTIGPKEDKTVTLTLKAAAAGN
jgi:plastocyanin